MRWSDRRKRFRALLAGDGCIHPASVFDALSARIAEDLGFEAGMFAGSVASLTVLGAPDVVVLTLSEFAEQAQRICRAGELPVMVDADHGYGNALSVARTIEELETAGIAAATIEDTALPQPYGAAAPQLTSVEEGIGKMRAALGARRDPDFVVVGRTSAVSISGLDDAIARAKAYEKAGVDAQFFTGIQAREQLDAIAAAVSLPIVLGNSPAEWSAQELAAKGVRIALRGHQPIAAAVQAVYDTMKALREGTPPSALKGLPTPALMDRVTRAGAYKKAQEDFLGLS
jgi:carboxyvinyl-carboxyphosphonate phosphorylmutase